MLISGSRGQPLEPLLRAENVAKRYESGGAFGPVRADASFGESEPLASAEKRTVDWLSAVGIPNILELRKIPADKLQTIIPRQFGWARPNVDGWVIRGDQYELYESKQYNDVPVLTGYNSDEGATLGSPKTQEAYVHSVRERYKQFADKILAAYPGGENPAEKWTARNLMRDSAFSIHVGHLCSRIATHAGRGCRQSRGVAL